MQRKRAREAGKRDRDKGVPSPPHRGSKDARRSGTSLGDAFDNQAAGWGDGGGVNRGGTQLLWSGRGWFCRPCAQELVAVGRETNSLCGDIDRKKGDK